MLAELIDERVSCLRPLQVGDYGFIMTDSGVMIGKGMHKFYSSVSGILRVPFMGIVLLRRFRTGSC